MGRTIDALKIARGHLSGDKVHGYSNLLGVMSALVSHEHFEIDTTLYTELIDTLEGDTEHDFGLREKINLAQAQRIDGADGQPKRPGEDKA